MCVKNVVRFRKSMEKKGVDVILPANYSEMRTANEGVRGRKREVEAANRIIRIEKL